jgi:integrase
MPFVANVYRVHSKTHVQHVFRICYHEPMAGKRYQEGTVEITGKKKDTWTGYFYVYDLEGQRHRHSANLGPVKGVNRKQAMGKLRPIVEKETGQPTRTSGEDTVAWYWLQRFAPFQNWRPTTRTLVEDTFKAHVLPQIGSTKLKDVDKYQLQILLQRYTGYSQDFIGKIRTYLKIMFERALDDDLIPKNPMRFVETPTSTQKPTERFLTMEELDRLFAELAPRGRLICRIAVVLGLRPGELFALTWEDYNLMKTELRVDKAYVRQGKKAGGSKIQDTKTKASVATIRVPATIIQELGEWRKATTSGSHYIFPTLKGGPMCRMWFLRLIKEAAVRAEVMQPRPKGLPKGQVWGKETAVNFQAMRRTCATWTGAQPGATIKDVQTIMRHGKAETSLKYYMKAIPESTIAAMAGLDARLAFGAMATSAPASSMTM